ncbi:hypothetical protein PIROE2DRAFT_64157 [Piromyces sp. E2]|nr:hypothetical protein PIROE2DRAFT_64157 [Piromyces sp. E2]|eukprot:OUM58839.1 hypothetical protein PIROE2DRAFT_64157 [Piromyces sp. E2]
MKSTTLLTLFTVLIIHIYTVWAENVSFDQNGGKSSIIVDVNTNFNVELKGNPTTGYSWYLENVDEIKNSVIEPINLNEENTGDYIQNQNKRLSGAGGVFLFSFRVKNIVKDPPTLKFIYKRPWESEAITSAEVTVTCSASSAASATTTTTTTTTTTAIPEKQNNPHKDDNGDDDNKNKKRTIVFPSDGGSDEIDVDQGDFFDVCLDGNPTTGYSWTLENAHELTGIQLLNEEGGDYIQNQAREGMIGVGGSFLFKFQVMNVEELPSELKFIYQRPWQSKPISTAEVAITRASKDTSVASEPSVVENEVTFQQNDTKGEIIIKKNSTFTIKIKGNPSTGYAWKLTNEKELAKAGITTIINGKYLASSSTLLGSGGIYQFQFTVGDTHIKNLPSITFTNKRSWSFLPGKKLVVSLKLNSTD